MTQLSPMRFQSSEYVNHRWNVVPEIGTPFEALLDPGYWAHCASNLRPGDTIEVRPEDGAYFATLFVRDASRLEARVIKIIGPIFMHEQVPDDVGELELKWRGPHKWCVLRGADVLVEGLGAKEDAKQWIGKRAA
jgi:hypothetical protein